MEEVKKYLLIEKSKIEEAKRKVELMKNPTLVPVTRRNKDATISSKLATKTTEADPEEAKVPKPKQRKEPLRSPSKIRFNKKKLWLGQL